MDIKILQQKINNISAGYAGQDEAIKHLAEFAAENGFTECVTGDACQGDEIVFIRATFTGGSFSRRGRSSRPQFNGYQAIAGKIVNDSYGRDKQQHTFTIRTDDDSCFCIKGRNLYANNVFAKPRSQSERESVLSDKHARGANARAIRDERKLLSY